MSKNFATLVGFGAVLLWALLAFFTQMSGKIPPFQLAAMSFAIAGAAGASTWIFRPHGIKALKQSWQVWAIGVFGLFGYHFVYFSALRAAPAVEASLIAYTWPLLIVLFSTLATGEKLRVFHVIGAGLGFAGAMLIVTGGGSFSLKGEFLNGYLLAFAAALIWSFYSILSRRFAHVPTDVVTGFCIFTAVLATLAHLALETTVWPGKTSEWFGVVGLGLGPVGLAFYLWDAGVKHGDIQALGAVSYSAPLLSTFVLIGAGLGTFSWSIGIACLLITLGAVIASAQMLGFSKTRIEPAIK